MIKNFNAPPLLSPTAIKTVVVCTSTLDWKSPANPSLLNATVSFTLPHLFVDLVKPDWVDWTSAKSADSQKILELRIVDKNNILAHEPSETLSARWRGQGALVGEKVLVGVDLIEGKVEVDGDIRYRDIVEKRRACRKLGEEVRAWSVRMPVNEEPNDSTRRAVFGVMDKMEFCLGTIAVDGVLSWRVSVPAFEIDGLIHPVVIECHLWKAGVGRVAVQSPLRAEVPVAEGSREVRWVAEPGNVVA